jgi:hypothetical protein
VTIDLAHSFRNAVLNIVADENQPAVLGTAGGTVYYNDGITNHKDRVWVRSGADKQVLLVAKAGKKGLPNVAGLEVSLVKRHGTVYVDDWQQNEAPSHVHDWVTDGTDSTDHKHEYDTRNTVVDKTAGTLGTDNVIIGNLAAENISTASQSNVIIGSSAGLGNVSGSSNVIIGTSAGAFNTATSGATFGEMGIASCDPGLASYYGAGMSDLHPSSYVCPVSSDRVVVVGVRCADDDTPDPGYDVQIVGFVFTYDPDTGDFVSVGDMQVIVDFSVDYPYEFDSPHWMCSISMEDESSPRIAVGYARYQETFPDEGDGFALKMKVCTVVGTGASATLTIGDEYDLNEDVRGSYIRMVLVEPNTIAVASLSEDDYPQAQIVTTSNRVVSTYREPEEFVLPVPDPNPNGLLTSAWVIEPNRLDDEHFVIHCVQRKTIGSSNRSHGLSKCIKHIGSGLFQSGDWTYFNEVPSGDISAGYTWFPKAVKLNLTRFVMSYYCNVAGVGNQFKVGEINTTTLAITYYTATTAPWSPQSNAFHMGESNASQFVLVRIGEANDDYAVHFGNISGNTITISSEEEYSHVSINTDQNDGTSWAQPVPYATGKWIVGVQHYDNDVDGWNCVDCQSTVAMIWGFSVLSGAALASNTFVGYQAGGSSTGNNSICLGANAGENNTDDYRLFIDVSNTATPLIYGEFDDDNVGIRTIDMAGGVGVIAIANATTAPASTPTGGGVLYVESGALKYKGSSGTVTTLGPA